MICICVASGPSLTAEDCDLVRLSGLPVIAVNNSWRLVPFCQHLCAMDDGWWRHNKYSLPSHIAGWTCNRGVSRRYGLQYFERLTTGSFNSGQCAIELAYRLGFSRILLLGYDCSLKDGIHWHGPHMATPNPTSQSIDKWQGEFALTRQHLPAMVEVINCSRRTELTCFPRSGLMEELGRLSLVPVPQPGASLHLTTSPLLP